MRRTQVAHESAVARGEDGGRLGGPVGGGMADGVDAAVPAMQPAVLRALAGTARADAGLRELRRGYVAALPPRRPRNRGVVRAAANGRQKLVSAESRGGWVLTIARGARRRYDLQASLATLRHPRHVCRVTLNGRPLSRRAWSYDAHRRLLRARFSARGAKLAAGSRCGPRLP